MAESGSWGKGGDGSSRKKRAWRKPREPPTPSLGAEEKASKSLKLVRGASSGEALSSATPRAVAAPPLAGSAAVEAVISSRDGEDTVEKLVVLGADKEMSREVSHDQEPPLKSPVTINGSIMEGVRLVQVVSLMFIAKIKLQSEKCVSELICKCQLLSLPIQPVPLLLCSICPLPIQ